MSGENEETGRTWFKVASASLWTQDISEWDRRTGCQWPEEEEGEDDKEEESEEGEKGGGGESEERPGPPGEPNGELKELVCHWRTVTAPTK